MPLLQPIDKVLFRAKRSLLRNNEFTFLGYIILGLNFIITEAVPTASVNKNLQLKLNPNFFLNLKPQEQIFLLAHEALHVVLCHFNRMLNKDPYQWNIAADYLINSYLVDKGMTCPEDGCYNSIFNDKKWTTETIYEYLNQHPHLIPPKFELDIEDIPQNTSDIKKQLSKVKDLISSAASMSNKDNSYGSVPSFVKRELDKTKGKLINWSILLRRYLDTYSSTDYSWSKPSRRYVSGGYYFPSMREPDLVKITVAIDTSGSVTQQMLKSFVSEVNSIYSKYNPESLELLQFSYGITDSVNVQKQSDFENVTLKGGGGTCVKQVLQSFTESSSKVLVIITDGYFNTDLINPNKDVIWVIYDNYDFTISFGTVCHITLGDL